MYKTEYNQIRNFFILQLNIFMNILKYFFFLLLPSCMSVYKAPIQVTPAMKEKGDLAIAGAATYYWAQTGAIFGSIKFGFAGYLAYSPINHLYFGASADRVGSNNGSHKYSNHSSYQFLTGYYSSLDKDNKAYFDFQAGGGRGQGHEYNFYDGLTSAAQSGDIMYGKFWNVYLQPGIHLGKESFKADLGIKFNLVHIYDQHDISMNWNTNKQNNNYLMSPMNSALLEPSGTIRIKEGPFNYFCQGFLSLPMGESSSVSNNVNIRPQMFNFYVGISVSLTEDFNLYTILKKSPTTRNIKKD